eukprot:SAG31_NODE_33209_length_346_cov_1.246964_1_plen_23_part_01
MLNLDLSGYLILVLNSINKAYSV